MFPNLIQRWRFGVRKFWHHRIFPQKPLTAPLLEQARGFIQTFLNKNENPQR